MNIVETNLPFSALSKRSKTNRVILHHAEAKTCSAADIHSWHKNNGWAGIGYHFVIRKNGTIERGRPEDTIGAHASNNNSDSIGICFEGDFMTETMGQAQIKAGQELIGYLKAKYSMDKVQKHKDVCATSCPGTNFPFDTIVNGAVAPQEEETPKTENKESKGEKIMQCFYQVDGKGPVYYFDGLSIHPLSHPDEKQVLNMIYKENNGKDMPFFSWKSSAPWHNRLKAAINRKA